jgi:hypothetical protein
MDAPLGLNLTFGLEADRQGLGGLDLAHAISGVGVSVGLEKAIGKSGLYAFSDTEARLDLTGPSPTAEVKVTSGLGIRW